MQPDISQQWKVNPHINKMAEKIPIQKFKETYKQKNINVQFRIVSFMTQTEHHTQRIYKNPDHFIYNRHSSIMTFDNTRVILGEQADRQKPQNYINANIIQIDGKKVIATQGPKLNTLVNFWRMIDEQKVTTIFMLCCRVENNRPQCDTYWPTHEHGEPLKLGSYFITKTHQKEEDNMCIRNFYFVNTENNIQKNVTQYQLKNWPDGKIPLPQAKKNVDYILQKFINCIHNLEVPLVHCSAGVGRTGTFIAMADLTIQIKNKQKISIFQTVRTLREQRWGMVYTSMQYQYLYQFAKNLIDEIENKSQSEQVNK